MKPKMSNTNTGLEWTEDAFQALAYWLGYQPKRLRYYPIRKITVVTELAALLHTSAQRKGWHIESESSFPKVLNPSPPASKGADLQKRVDLSIGPSEAAATYAIEVKVLREIAISGTPSWAKDLHRLRRLKQHNPMLEVRLVLVTESSLPATLLSDAGKAVKTEQILTDGTRFRGEGRSVPCRFYPSLKAKMEILF